MAIAIILAACMTQAPAPPDPGKAGQVAPPMTEAQLYRELLAQQDRYITQQNNSYQFSISHIQTLLNFVGLLLATASVIVTVIAFRIQKKVDDVESRVKRINGRLKRLRDKAKYEAEAAVQVHVRAFDESLAAINLKRNELEGHVAGFEELETHVRRTGDISRIARWNIELIHGSDDRKVAVTGELVTISDDYFAETLPIWLYCIRRESKMPPKVRHTAVRWMAKNSKQVFRVPEAFELLFQIVNERPSDPKAVPDALGMVIARLEAQPSDSACRTCLDRYVQGLADDDAEKSRISEVLDRTRQMAMEFMR